MEKKSFDLSSLTLHILAMLFMLLDHMWATGIVSYDWCTCIGRLAFPIFSFMIVEGYYHTSNFKRYLLRLLVLAVISELPFNLMVSGELIFPFHQNVIWTFLLGLLTIRLIDRIFELESLPLRLLASTAAVLLSFLIGMVSMADFYGFGVLTVLLFYLFRGDKWWCRLGQLAGLSWINLELLGGLVYPFTLFGHSFEFAQQGFAVFALIFIWLYKGRQGAHNKAIQYAFYLFYPVHMLILSLIALS